MSTEFLWRNDHEPHRERRRRLLRNHPEVRTLMGFDRRSAFVIVALVSAQLLAAALIEAGIASQAIHAWLVLPLAYAGGVMNHWLAMGIHECAHDLAARSERTNRWLAIVANVPLVVPSAMSFRRHHGAHHQHLGDPAKDNDLPSAWERRAFRGKGGKLLWLLTFPLTMAFTRGFLRRPDHWEMLNVAAQAGANIAIVWALGGWALLYLWLSTFFGMGLRPVAAHWVHEHYLFERSQETYSDYGPLNAVTFNVGYHVEHHDLFNIPGSRLPALRAMAPELYEGRRSHRSWTAILWRFVTDPSLSHGARVARSAR